MYKSLTDNYFGLPNDTTISAECDSVLVNFLQSSQCVLLRASINREKELCLQTQIGGVSHNAIIFYKTKAQAVEDEDSFKNIGIITFPQTPIESIYLSLRHVYSPLMLEENNAFSAKLQQSILDLESSLRVIAYGRGGDQNVNVILSVEDEKDYWNSIINGKHSKKEKEAAIAFHELFEQICEEVRSLHTNAMSEIQECLENLGGLLDDIWRHNSYIYPQSRMVHIFDIIGNLCVTSVQKTMSPLETWKVHGSSRDSETLLTLQEGSKAIGTWLSACSTLTGTYWPHHSLHPWDGAPYVPQLCLMFHGRLNAIYDIRSVHHQLNKLLTVEEQKELNTRNMFQAFENIDVWICTPGNKHVWDDAVAYTTSVLKPAEMRIADKLKPRLHNSSTKQMLQEFIRYKSLIERPIVKAALHSELQVFVVSIGGLLKEIEGQMESDEVFEMKNYRAPETSAVVHQIQWAKQTESRVQGIKNIVESLLMEFEGSSDLLHLTKNVLNELKNMYTRLYEEWSRDLQMELKEGTLQLSVDKPVVEFSSSSRMMTVQFNPKLASVESSARAMAALGMPPPPNVREAIDKAVQFLQHARALQQVASFHNTLAERMIPSCRSMMLQAALELSSLVQQQRKVYWDKLAEVAQYADTLRQAVVKLESQNSYLTSQHIAIRNIVAQLMETDLLGKHGEWKKLVRDIRELIEKVEESGYKNTAAWRAHWDAQLYKALECQYIKSLLSLHAHFPPVRVELTFRGHKVVMQPPMEELRVQHYNMLRRLVSLPSQFVGLQADITASESMFTSIVQKHSWLGNKAVKQMEAALSGVGRVVDGWTRRAALGAVDSVEQLCRDNLKAPDDWPANFKACKAYGQAVAKMTFDDEKVEWISIGTASLRREFEAQVRNLWACLISSLQASCQEDVALVDTFVANAQVTLEKRAAPKSARELAVISAAQNSLRERFPEMEKIVDGLKKKQHTLRTWGGDQSIDSTVTEWAKIQELMVSQQQLFEHQAEVVMSSLTGEWRNLSSSVEVWLSRWVQTRSKLTQLDGVSFEDVQGRAHQVADAVAQWGVFCAERDDILKESEKFNLKLEISHFWKEAEETLAEDSKIWEVFKEYNEAFTSLGQQEWIVFQKKLHMLDEFVSEWSGRMEPYTSVTLYLQQHIDNYKDMTPMLKYLRGNDFTERHWREVFGLLELENKTGDTLLVKDLLKVASNIKKHIKTLQKISASASSESAIRGALNELELWYAGARFTISYYKDKAGKSIPIVKDFKEILTKIEEQQWVVLSVRGGDGGVAEEACGLWEARLRAAQELTRATHHAQRRKRTRQ